MSENFAEAALVTSPFSTIQPGAALYKGAAEQYSAWAHPSSLHPFVMQEFQFPGFLTGPARFSGYGVVQGGIGRFNDGPIHSCDTR